MKVGDPSIWVTLCRRAVGPSRNSAAAITYERRCPVQSMLSPEQEISLLELCRLLCPAETRACEAAIIALRQPATPISWKAETPRSGIDCSGDSRKHSSLPRYADDDDYDNSDFPSATGRGRRQEERTEQAIAAACLKTIVGVTTEAAVASACAISRKGSLLPPSFFAQPQGRMMVQDEIRAQLYGLSRNTGPWANSAFVVHRRQEWKALADAVGKGGIVVVPTPAIEPAAQERAGSEGRNPNEAAKKRPSRKKKQEAFSRWLEDQPPLTETRKYLDLQGRLYERH